MKWIAYNFLSICFILFAAYLVYLDKSGWGWLIFCALISCVMPSTNKK